MDWRAVQAALATPLLEWRSVRVSDLQYWHRSDARLVLTGLLLVCALALIARTLLTRQPGRHHLVVPGVPPSVRSSWFAGVRHLPLLLALAGLPCFALAVADPFTALVQSEVSYPGRRIALMLDASTSMRSPFKAEHLNQRAATDAAFYTTVAAADRFVRLRMKERYRDLMALVEFGNEAYVVTPFTNDYDNILLSISLVGDPVEFSLFPDQGTVIGNAIDQSIGLFKAFDFLESNGNLMVLFSDGEDTRVMIGSKTLDDIVESAMNSRIPVYMVRTNYERGKGKVIPDEIWAPAIAKTGGRFYAADSEAALLAAINDIDKVSAGTIATKQYTSQRPRFGMFAVAALACWCAAVALKLGLSIFQKVP